MITREEFIQGYVTMFLASYAATNYDMNCARGWPDQTQPVEDARLLAEQAWRQLKKHGGIGGMGG